MALGKLGGDDGLKLAFELRHQARQVLGQPAPDKGREHLCVLAQAELGVLAQHGLEDELASLEEKSLRVSER